MRPFEARPLGPLWVKLIATLWLAVVGVSAHAQLPESADNCLACHDDPQLNAVLHGPHAVLSDSRNRFAEQGCGSCHGASEEHMRRPPRGEPRAATDIRFVKGEGGGAGDAVCLDCHHGNALHWTASAHADAGLACVDCHRLHTLDDPMSSAEAEVEHCASCHRKEHAEFMKVSAHPLDAGRMQCSDCHAAHGSATPAALTRPTINETCHECHAEMRGPFLWEHPPAREDCMSCHTPHGSAHGALLKQRTPFLCQQCHLAQFHPSTALSGTGLSGSSLPSGSTSLMGQDCLNCHQQVHGSNHPSGVGATR
ncbi:DmsE family decaheme c-type cytochrome [Aquimonas sp.]|jgi:DmsE family decaheme c-type cytochrome|uniref:DmsE family decaheme c-type cytochrome n=1 Tax=Aquimonas sp. TaxID=1872588 RepID=UPI0037BF0C1E